MSAKPLPLETHASSGSTAAFGLSRWLPLLAIFVAGIALRNFVVANTDVSWLITLCEKALNVSGLTSIISKSIRLHRSGST